VTAQAAPAAAARPGSRRRWLGLFFIALGVAMIIVDATIVNVAVPQIIKDLGITSSDAQWVQEVYTLVFAALLLVWGRLADRYGRRLLFVTGAAAFAAASVLAALTRSGPELIGSRVLQGIAAAMMLPTSLSLLNAGFRGRDRTIAFAVWGSTIGGTAALGPLLGGWLTTPFGSAIVTRSPRRTPRAASARATRLPCRSRSAQLILRSPQMTAAASPRSRPRSASRWAIGTGRPASS
jgi:MFS family permease